MNKDNSAKKFENLFQSENEILTNYKSGKSNDLAFLIKKFDKLLKESKKMVRLNDKQQKIVKEKNEALKFLTTSNQIAYQDLEDIYSKIKKDLLFSTLIQKTALMVNYNKKKFDINTIYQPTDDIGGDIYHILGIPKNRLRVFIADATGHGVQAALITLAIDSQYSHYKKEIPSPGEILSAMNHFFYTKYYDLGLFFTAFILDIDLDKNIIIFSGAGHPDQISVQNGEIELLQSSHPPIGVLDKIKFKNKIAKFDRDGLICLFTDGLLEESDSNQQEYGMKRLIKIIEDNNKLTVEKINRAIKQSLSNFSGKKILDDDLTIVSIKSLGAKNV